MQKIKKGLRKMFLSAGSSLVLWMILSKLALAEWDIDAIPDTGLPDPSDGIYGIITGIMGWLLAIIGVVGVIGFAIAGLMYLTAAGDDDQIKKAKKAMTASIIGVIVAICGIVVLRAVDMMLNASGIF